MTTWMYCTWLRRSPYPPQRFFMPWVMWVQFSRRTTVCVNHKLLYCIWVIFISVAFEFKFEFEDNLKSFWCRTCFSFIVILICLSFKQKGHFNLIPGALPYNFNIKKKSSQLPWRPPHLGHNFFFVGQKLEISANF